MKLIGIAAYYTTSPKSRHYDALTFRFTFLTEEKRNIYFSIPVSIMAYDNPEFDCVGFICTKLEHGIETAERKKNKQLGKIDRSEIEFAMNECKHPLDNGVIYVELIYTSYESEQGVPKTTQL